ncbi:hypothetical protein B0182_02865 [Moraxella bovis]|nr:hypothetical protein DQF64_05810 [Moraxella bovis]OOR91406.1 hypothetical protein B0182_02865 [Moraxella bovis]
MQKAKNICNKNNEIYLIIFHLKSIIYLNNLFIDFSFIKNEIANERIIFLSFFIMRSNPFKSERM